jgi:hypothetical protein
MSDIFDEIDKVSSKYVTPNPATREHALDNSLVRGARSGTLGAASQLQALTGAVAEASGSDEFANARYADSQRLSLRAQDEAPRISSVGDIHGVGDALSYGAGMVGQSLPYMAAGTAAAMAAPAGLVPGALAATAALTPFEAGDVVQRQLQDPQAKLRTPGDRLENALKTGVVSAATQAVVPTIMTGKLLGRTAATAAKKSTGAIIGRGVNDVALEGATEGAGEVIKQTGTNSDKPLDWEAIGENAAGGLAGGAAMGGAGTAGELLHAKAEPIKGFVDRAADAAAAGAKFIGSKAGGLTETVTDAAGPDGYDLGGKATAAAKAGKGLFGRAAEAVGPDGYDLSGKAADFVGRAKDAGASFVGSAADTAKEATKAVAGYDVKDAAGTALDKITSAFRRAKDTTMAAVSRVADQEDFADPQAFAGKEGDALKAAVENDDKGRVAMARDWATELWQSNVSPAQREQLRAAMGDLSNKANQAVVAGMKRAKVVADTGRTAVSAFAAGMKQRADERKAGADVKKSEDYAGVDRVIKDTVGPFLAERAPHLMESPENINALAPALRSLIGEMSAGKPVSVDTYMDLLAVAGEHTVDLLDKVHGALKETDPKKIDNFFGEVNAIDQIAKDHAKLVGLMDKHSVNGAGSTDPSVLNEVARGLVQWAQLKPDSESPARQKARDARIMDELQKQFGSKAGAILNAAQSLVKKAKDRPLSGRTDTNQVRYDEDGKEVTVEDGTDDVAPDTRLVVHGVHLNEDASPGGTTKAGEDYDPAIVSAMRRYKERNPNASLERVKASTMLDHPAVQKAKAKFFAQKTLAEEKRLLASGVEPNEARARAVEYAREATDEAVNAMDVVVSESATSHTALSSDDMPGILNDGHNHSRSRAKFQIGGANIDAVKLTSLMQRRFAKVAKYSPSEEKNSRLRAAHMFMEGVAALQDRFGEVVDIPDSTVITRGGMTWGEAKALDARTDDDKGNDRASQRLVELRKQFKTAEGKTKRDIAAKGKALSALQEHRVNREQGRPDDNGVEQDDPTGFEGGVERGIFMDKAALKNGIAEVRKQIDVLGKQLDGEAAFGQGPAEVKVRQQLARLTAQLNDMIGRLDARAANTEDLGTGQQEFDPFGPTFQNGRNLDFPGRGEINTDGGELREPGVRAPSLLGLRAKREGPPDPKGVAAKKAAFLEKARSGDDALIETLKASNDAKGLQRAAEALLAEPKGEGVDATLDAVNARLSKLVIDPDTAYSLQTKRYSLQAVHVSNERHDGRFNWREHWLSGQGEARVGAGTYLMPANNAGAHANFKGVMRQRMTPKQFEATGYQQGEPVTYSVTLDAEPHEIMLWDLKLSSQPKQVQEALISAARALGMSEKGVAAIISEDSPAHEIYGYYLYNRVFDMKKVSDALDKAGIVGAQYRSARGPEYVIYRDSRISTNAVHFDKTRTDPNATGPRDLAGAMAYLHRVLGNSVLVEHSPIMHAGEFEAVLNHQGGIDDVIRLSVHSLDPLSVAHHEALHAFFAKLSRQQNGEIVGILEKAASSPLVTMQLHKLLAGQPEALAQLANPEERAAYMYQFWAAGKLALNPEAASFFGRVAEFIRSVLGVWSNDERALHILEYFHRGGFAQDGGARDAVAEALMEPGRNARLEAFKRMVQPVTDLGEQLAVAGHQRLRDTGIPALVDLANLMKLQTTGEGDDQGYLPAARQERSRRMNELGEVLAGMSANAMNAAMESMQQNNANGPIDALANPEEQRAARTARAALRATLDDAHAYMSEAGVDVGDLGLGEDYFPRIWDAGYISSHQTEFLNMLEGYVRSGEFTGSPKDLMHRLMTTDGAEVTPEIDRPGMQHLKPRELAFITGADAAPFVNKNLYETMNRYITQATRRAEWARRMGDDGKQLTELLNRAMQEGASAADMDAAKKYVRAVDGTLGDSVNPEWRRLQGNMIVYQNIRLLPLAIFSSIVDPMGIVVRGGSVSDAFNALKRGVRGVVKNFKSSPDPDEAESVAAMLGTIDSVMLAHTLGSSFNQGMVGDRARKINDWFFRMNLMEQFNTDMRVGATQAAISFIKKHRKGDASAHSMRWLAELGLTPTDIHLNMAGDLVLTEAEGLSPEAAGKMHAAVNRWVDGAVLRPDAADKPLWMSDPRYAILAHLKQFVFAFHETILKRVAHELQAGNYTPAYALASYVPVMIAADAAKGIIQGGGGEPAWKRDWGAADYLWAGVERGGLLGTGQFAADALVDIKRGGSGLGHLAGPTIEQLAAAVQVVGGRAQFAPFLLKSMPANALYAPAFREEPREEVHPE